MPIIKQLPPSVVNKIAAGEVIERPASVVKELLENAVDAGATRIDVSLEEGGAGLIRVRDNGCGMSAEQLPLAVASHATSKIQSAEDLFQVGTLGFRGEALASIAEISHLSIISCAEASDSGSQLEVTGGRKSEITPVASPRGTTIEVRQLFFNTPVRRKFMRRTQTESGHCSEAFTRIALAHPEIHFTLRNQTRTLHDLPACKSLRERIAAFFGPELAEGLIWVESGDDEYRLSGYVARPDHSRSHARMQYVFLNRRHIRDRALQHALSEAYRGLLLTGRHSIVFLQLELPPEVVDVNVHPTKLEVRFQESGRVYSHLLGTLRSRFLSTDLGSVVRPADEQSSAAVDSPEGAVDQSSANAVRQDYIDWARGKTPPPKTAESQSELELQFEGRQSGAPLALNQLERHWPGIAHAVPTDLDGTGLSVTTPSSAHGASEEGPAIRHDQPHGAQPRAMAVQIHDRYIVTESEEGVVIIDQHALHERILYEELRGTLDGGTLEVQRMLIPEPVHLAAAESAAILQSQEVLAKLGIQVEGFGGDTVLVTAYPAMLSDMSPAEMIRQVVEVLVSGSKQPERRDLLDELLHMISCKAAIKAGDRLAQGEMEELLVRKEACRDSHHCPHGRPTWLVFTREELDRRFKRI